MDYQSEIKRRKLRDGSAWRKFVYHNLGTNTLIQVMIRSISWKINTYINRSVSIVSLNKQIYIHCCICFGPKRIAGSSTRVFIYQPQATSFITTILLLLVELLNKLRCI